MKQFAASGPCLLLCGALICLNFNIIWQLMSVVDDYNPNMDMQLSHNPTIVATQDFSKQSCDYINVKGMEKSGTTWLENSVLPTIINRACIISNYSFNLCKNDRIGHERKHMPSIPRHKTDPIINGLSLKTYPKYQRECTITVFRDPRDRIVSWAYFAYRDNDSQTFEIVNKNVQKDFEVSLKLLKKWWGIFHDQHRIKYPLLFFDYFYENLVINPRDVVINIIDFIGFHQVFFNHNINESIIDDIITKIEWNNLMKEKIDTFRSNRNNGRINICTFKQFLDMNTLQFMNEQLIKIDLPKGLIYEWNKLCPFDKIVLSHYRMYTE